MCIYIYIFKFDIFIYMIWLNINPFQKNRDRAQKIDSNVQNCTGLTPFPNSLGMFTPPTYFLPLLWWDTPRVSLPVVTLVIADEGCAQTGRTWFLIFSSRGCWECHGSWRAHSKSGSRLRSEVITDLTASIFSIRRNCRSTFGPTTSN